MGVKPTGIFKSNGKTFVTYKCETCGFVGNMRMSHFNNGVGCSVCSGKKVLRGFNDIATTLPDVSKFIVPQSDANKYSKNSHKTITVRCPICCFEKNIAVSQLSRYGFKCPMCYGGISYPNRFMSSLLSIANITFESEKSFEWCGRLRYDFYIPKFNTIVEMHGKQHYCDVKGWSRLSDIMVRDNEKIKLANHNGIDNYIVIDASNSEQSFIIKSICSSKLFDVLHIKECDIDFNTVCDIANKYIAKECLDLWNSGVHSTKQISSKLGITSTTVVSYMKQYASIGLCEYDATEERDKCRKCANEARKRKVICVTNNTIFNSINEAAEFASVTPNAIQNCLAGRCETSGRDSNNNKLKWQYL